MSNEAASVSAIKPKDSLGRLIAIVAGGDLTAMLIRLVSGLITARLVEPSVMGFFNAFALALGYSPFLQLGVMNGLNRELPYLVGRGLKDEAYEMAAVAQFWSLAISVVGGLVFVGLSVYYAVQSRWQYASGWGTMVFSLVALFYGQYYLQATFRTHSDFKKLTAANMVQSVVSFVTLVFVWLFGFYGLCLRSIVTLASNVGALWHWRPVKVAPKWNWKQLSHLIKIGLPIFAVGQIYSYWSVLNLTLVFHYSGKEGLGLYQLSVIIGSATELIPMAVMQVVYPKMAQSWGQSENLDDLTAMVKWPILYILLGGIPFIIAGWVCLPYVVSFILPKYVGGIPAAQWSLLCAYTMCLQPLNEIYNVIKRQDLYAISLIVGGGVYASVLLSIGGSAIHLERFPQAIIVGRLAFFAVSYLSLMFLSKSGKYSKKTS